MYYFVLILSILLAVCKLFLFAGLVYLIYCYLKHDASAPPNYFNNHRIGNSQFPFLLLISINLNIFIMKILKTVTHARHFGFTNHKFLPKSPKSFGLWYWTIFWQSFFCINQVYLRYIQLISYPLLCTIYIVIYYDKSVIV